MASQFIPFSGLRPVATEPPAFEATPAPRPIPTGREPGRNVPATKEWADLTEALHLGLGPAELDVVTRGLPLGARDRSPVRPLVLRDFGPPVEPPPDSGRIPTIVVTRADDIVRKVTIECTCGETISLDCVY